MILTVCIQIAVFPLTRKSLEHSVKMKNAPAQLKALQTQFKSDPKRLQIETLNLYKKHGMNFMGARRLLSYPAPNSHFLCFLRGFERCLRASRRAVDFLDQGPRGADPLHVLPILMGAGMFASAKLTTVPTDPEQARMAMMMPIVFRVHVFSNAVGTCSLLDHEQRLHHHQSAPSCSAPSPSKLPLPPNLEKPGRLL